MDVTDVQWYVFVSALPAALPVLMLFIFISHQLRKRRGSLVETVTTIHPSSTVNSNGSAKKTQNNKANESMNDYGLSNGKTEKNKWNGSRHV